MTTFKYKAVAKNGGVVYGEIDAPSKAVAIARLQNSGYLPVSADEISTQKNFFNKLTARSSRKRRISKTEVTLLTRELATLLQAGLPLDSALKTLENLTASEPVKEMISNIHQKVQSGVSLADAMAEHSSTFNRLYINMFRAGEASGSMHTVIERMAEYLERMGELRSTVFTAMIYPVILTVISLISLVILMTFVVPKFIPLFEDAGQTLPLITQFVFNLSELFRAYWWLLLGIFTLLVWGADKLLADPARRLRFDAWTLGLPYIGELLAQIDTTRFARTLSTLLINGVPVMTAVTLVRDVISNRAMSRVMDTVISSLEQGQRVAKPLKDSQYFPQLSVQLIEVGEESGQLEAMLTKIADIYDQQVQSSVKRLLTLLEPVIILVLGGIIALIILSILLAILGLNELIH